MSYGSTSGQNLVDQPRLSLGWVAATHLEVGIDVTGTATLGGSPAAGDAPQVSLVGVMPHVGYLAPIRDALCLWVRAGVAYYLLGEKGVDASPGGRTAWSFTWRQLDVDVEAHMAVSALPHVAITAGIVAELPVIGRSTSHAPAGCHPSAAARRGCTSGSSAASSCTCRSVLADEDGQVVVMLRLPARPRCRRSDAERAIRRRGHGDVGDLAVDARGQVEDDRRRAVVDGVAVLVLAIGSARPSTSSVKGPLVARSLNRPMGNVRDVLRAILKPLLVGCRAPGSTAG